MASNKKTGSAPEPAGISSSGYGHHRALSRGGHSLSAGAGGKGKQPPAHSSMSDLRRMAEQGRRHQACDLAAAPSQDPQVLIHELQIHQVELEMQNEELRQAQEQLYASQAELEEERYCYQSLFDFAPQAYLVTDLRGRIQEANLAASCLLGKDRQSLLGAALPVFFAERDMQLVLDAISAAREGRSPPPAPLEASIQQGDQPIPCEIAANIVKKPNGQVTALRWLLHDISQTKRTEALRQSEEQFRRAIEDAPVPTIMHAEDGQILQISRTWTELTGDRTEDMPTFDAWLNHAYGEGANEVRAHIQRLFADNGRTIGVEFPVLTRDGNTRYWSFSASSPGTLRDGRRFVVSSAVDITDRKQAERVLARDKVELERLVAERTARLQEVVSELEHFSYTITHDLKAPLRAMKGFAEIVRSTCGDCTHPDAKEALARISSSAQRMESLITDALNYGRAILQELPLTDVDTDALLRGILDSYPEFQPSHANIRVEGSLPVVLGNEAGLTQCLSNLLDNAIKFVSPGQKPDIRVRAEECEGWARIWVEDKGIGISTSMLPRVFQMFARGSKDYEGTGIGLALVRKVVQRMGGRTGAESEEGKGSHFWIELKLGQSRPEPTFSQPESPQPNSGTVLYVEDEESDAIFMKRAFAGKRLESFLRVVTDGRATIEYLSGAGQYADRTQYPRPSLVLLDLNLPQVSGFEVLKWMRNHPDFARTPVVVFSSSTREDDLVKARQMGANAFIAKPNTGTKFDEVVDRLREFPSAPQP